MSSCREQLNKTGGRSADTQESKRHKCEYCTKAFQHKYQLQMHTRTHTGEKPYACKSCPSKFSRKDTLVIHTRAHTGEKPYKCEYCKATFAQLCTLKDHTRTHTGERPYDCQFCDYSGATKSATIIHERTHTEEKPHKCQFCSYSAMQKGTLRDHENNHHSAGAISPRKKLYPCLVCSKVCHSSSHLNYHKQTHAGEKRHKCRFCDYSAINKNAVVMHERRRHTETGSNAFQTADLFPIVTVGQLCTVTNESRGTENRPEQPNVTVNHRQRSTGESLQSLCRTCGFSAASDAEIALHMTAAHKLPVVKLRRLKVIFN